jgi:hypothetical protein
MSKFYNVPVNAVGITRIITLDQKGEETVRGSKSIFIFGDPATTKKDMRLTLDDSYIWLSAPDKENKSDSTMFWYDELK